VQHKTYQSIVPIHRIIGNQGKVTTLTITGILYESGHNFIGNAVNTSHYKTNTGLEAVYSKKHGLLLHLEEHKQMSNGCYFHRQSILHHFDEIQRAVKYIVKNKVFDRQDRPDKMQEILCRSLTNQQFFKHTLLHQSDERKRFSGFCYTATSILSKIYRAESQEVLSESPNLGVQVVCKICGGAFNIGENIRPARDSMYKAVWAEYRRSHSQCSANNPDLALDELLEIVV